MLFLSSTINITNTLHILCKTNINRLKGRDRRQINQGHGDTKNDTVGNSPGFLFASSILLEKLTEIRNANSYRQEKKKKKKKPAFKPKTRGPGMGQPSKTENPETTCTLFQPIATGETGPPLPMPGKEKLRVQTSILSGLK